MAADDDLMSIALALGGSISALDNWEREDDLRAAITAALAQARIEATEQANAEQTRSWTLMCRKLVDLARADERERIVLAAIDIVAFHGCDVAVEAAIRRLTAIPAQGE